MRLKEYFASRRGEDVHLRLTGRVEIDGKVMEVGDDVVAVQTVPQTVMLVPFAAIQFVKETLKSLRPMLGTMTTSATT
ncbi:MAG TPA: hypothetical protein VEV38_09585 [Candidatus Eremiobacteraceae bacterium]|nr:hypothetical protein [Candidatus Eremiobacteraceae bacterium]